MIFKELWEVAFIVSVTVGAGYVIAGCLKGAGKTTGETTEINYNDFTIKQFDLKEGDYLILQTENVLSEKLLNKFREEIQTQFPGVKAIILEGGLKLTAVLSREKGEKLSENI